MAVLETRSGSIGEPADRQHYVRHDVFLSQALPFRGGLATPARSDRYRYRRVLPDRSPPASLTPNPGYVGGTRATVRPPAKGKAIPFCSNRDLAAAQLDADLAAAQLDADVNGLH